MGNYELIYSFIRSENGVKNFSKLCISLSGFKVILAFRVLFLYNNIEGCASTLLNNFFSRLCASLHVYI